MNHPSRDDRPDCPPAAELRQLQETYRAWRRLVEAMRAVLADTKTLPPR
jgi:hypothetical protein